MSRNPALSLFHASVAVLTLALATPLFGSTTYVASLSGSSEVPPTGSSATGAGELVLNGDLLTVAESFTGLSGPATGAHIHCCGPVGVNEPIAVPFPNFPASTAGTYSMTFDLTDNTIYTAGFLGDSGGTASGAEAALIAALNGGMAYLNIHDANFPGGEIEGYLTASATPEPTSAALLLVGLAPAVFYLRRRKAP